MAREPITDEQMLMCAEGEVCVTDHEPWFGLCNYCLKIKACTCTAHLDCGSPQSDFGPSFPCHGSIVLYPYIKQLDLRAAYRLGGMAAVEAIVRPRPW